MKNIILICILIAYASGATIYARAVISAVNNSGVNGTVLFSQTDGGNVTVQVEVSGIATTPNSPHGIHVHTFGDLTDDTAAASVGGHWNPTNAAHGCPETGGPRHYGDMGNWDVTRGVVSETKSLNLLTLTGANSIVGRAVIVHSQTDDCVTPNTGNAGSRLGYGVIGIINSTILTGSGEANNSVGNVMSANCKLVPSSGSNVQGMVWFFQDTPTSPTEVYAEVTGTTGAHGFHLHWFGDISKPDGTATGGHFNPTSMMHGIPPFNPRHIGDMGILNYTVAGTAYYRYTNDKISLNGINNVIGRAVHVHSNSDDCTNPVGNGGARLAQCVIGVANITRPTFPAGVPTTQNGISICDLVYPPATSAPSDASINGIAIAAFFALLSLFL